MAPIEIDGLPNLRMVDLSMANCECHNQMVLESMNISHEDETSTIMDHHEDETSATSPIIH